MFEAYTPLSRAELDQIWRSGIFAFDANVLLNVYRYSPSTRNQLLAVWGHLESRLWIPHQAALEFFRNRTRVIAQEARRYSDAAKTLQSLLAQLQSNAAAPFVGAECLKQFQVGSETLLMELSNGELRGLELLSADPTLARLRALFDGKIGPPLSDEGAAWIAAEGPRRTTGKIPPGYMDAGKDSEDRRNGDLVLWKQLLERATRSTPVILVTNDRKEDWWSSESGRFIGPRPELREEMSLIAGANFHLYTMESFLKQCSERGMGSVDSRALAEVDRVHTASTVLHRGDLVSHAELGLGVVESPQMLHNRRLVRVRFDETAVAVHLDDLRLERRRRSGPIRRQVTYTTRCDNCQHESSSWMAIGTKLFCPACEKFFRWRGHPGVMDIGSSRVRGPGR